MQTPYPKEEEKEMKGMMGNGKEAQKFASTSLLPSSLSGPILPRAGLTLKNKAKLRSRRLYRKELTQQA